MENYLTKNQLLIATPMLSSPEFEHSVIYLYEHSQAEGAKGVIINKPLQVKLESVLTQLNFNVSDKPIADHPILMGGPVEQQHGFILHMETKDDKSEMVVSTSKKTLENIAKGEGPDNFVVALGYAGWEPGQLEYEIAKNYWLVAPMDERIIFATPIAYRWRSAAELLGINIESLSTQAAHA